MAELKVAILGLDRMSMSIGLRLHSYMQKGGKHRFSLRGYDSREDFEKPARKLKVLDKVARKPQDAVAGADIVIMNLPYEDLGTAYELVGSTLQDGAVLLDTAVIKLPSQRWAADFLGIEQHWVGFTPIVAARYMLETSLSPSAASDDYFHENTIYLTPAVDCIKEAVDLAYNFALILGGKPAFLDPAEHDSLATLTEEIPQLLSVVAYRAAMAHNAWGDAQRLTNAPFAVQTRYLLTHHPDALRDEWLANSEQLLRAIDSLQAILSELRERLSKQDVSAIEAFLIATSDDYQTWINRRHKSDWEQTDAANVPLEQSLASSLLGGAITRRLFGGGSDESHARSKR